MRLCRCKRTVHNVGERDRVVALRPLLVLLHVHEHNELVRGHRLGLTCEQNGWPAQNHIPCKRPSERQTCWDGKQDSVDCGFSRGRYRFAGDRANS